MKKSLLLAIAALALGSHAQQAWDTHPTTWVAVDGLGRVMPTAGNGATAGIDRSLTTGMFYYIWHGQHGKEVMDITRLLNADPENPKWGDVGQFHWGGEPALSYYEGGDPFVVAKHMQWLIDAGIDFYFFDVTNASIYPDQVKAVMAEVDRRRALGLKTPKLAFMLHSATTPTLNKLYDAFYSKPEYDKYWFLWQGKPLVLANINDYTGGNKNVIDRFTWRDSWAWMKCDKPDEWPWLEHYPQELGWHNDGGKHVIEQISVSVAQHPSTGIGKSFHGGKEPELDKYGLCKQTPYGLYFQEQFNRAIGKRPPMLMITQWNEWMAQRYIDSNSKLPGMKDNKTHSIFVDVYNQEFSRDLEPSKEPLIRDNYYMQLVANMRRYQGAEEIAPVPSMTINAKGSFDQWNALSQEYRDEPGDVFYTSAKAQRPECLKRASNDLVEAKATADDACLYFYVRTAQPISSMKSSTATAWMTLLLNTDGDYSTGWNGYDYIVTNHGGKYQVMKSTSAKDYTWQPCGAPKYTVKGNQLQLAIPRSLLGKLAGNIDFKWADNTPATGVDILDFYVNGDVAPSTRFNYRLTLSK